MLHDGRRLDEVVENQFALITSSPLTDAQRNELSSRGAAVVHAAPGSELDRWPRSGRASAAIVRPDRAVMQAGKNRGDMPCLAFVLRSPWHPGQKRKMTSMTELLVLNAGGQEVQTVSLDGTRPRTLITGLNEPSDSL